MIAQDIWNQIKLRAHEGNVSLNTTYIICVTAYNIILFIGWSLYVQFGINERDSLICG